MCGGVQRLRLSNFPIAHRWSSSGLMHPPQWSDVWLGVLRRVHPFPELPMSPRLHRLPPAHASACAGGAYMVGARGLRPRPEGRRGGRWGSGTGGEWARQGAHCKQLRLPQGQETEKGRCRATRQRKCLIGRPNLEAPPPHK